MKPGKTRFTIQIKKIESLFTHAQTHENPSLWLFLHDLRTPVFMVEGLAKLYSANHNKKEFEKIKEKFKSLEDALGAVDYYAAFQKEFIADKKIPANILNFFKEKSNDKLLILNKLLMKEGWLNGSYLKNLRKKLDELDWQDEVDETTFFQKYYKKQAKKIGEFIQEVQLPFTDIELHVHELRRKIRWLSIYPQALNGAVKLVEKKPNLPHLNKYLTPEIVNSPFNQLLPSKTQNSFLVLNKNKFLALSWMIYQLGLYKDKGLKITALKNAFQAVNLLKDEAAFAEAYALLGKNYPTMAEILEQTSKISKTYFEEKNLDLVLL